MYAFHTVLRGAICVALLSIYALGGAQDTGNSNPPTKQESNRLGARLKRLLGRVEDRPTAVELGYRNLTVSNTYALGYGPIRVTNYGKFALGSRPFTGGGLYVGLRLRW